WTCPPIRSLSPYSVPPIRRPLFAPICPIRYITLTPHAARWYVFSLVYGADVVVRSELLLPFSPLTPALSPFRGEGVWRLACLNPHRRRARSRSSVCECTAPPLRQAETIACYRVSRMIVLR